MVDHTEKEDGWHDLVGSIVKSIELSQLPFQKIQMEQILVLNMLPSTPHFTLQVLFPAGF